MKHHNDLAKIGIRMCVALAMLGGSSWAGEIASGKESLVLDDDAPAPVKATLESRARYSYGDQDGLDDSHAGTLRSRLGLLTRELSGFQLFAEYEGTLTIDRDSYNDATGRRSLDKTVIADPESHELNQLWGSYRTPDDFLRVKAGRQGINLDNQRFVGTVGWRQNMQTYDAAAVTVSPVEDLDLYYGYAWKVNRVFGSEVVAPRFTDFHGNSHLVNVRYDGLPFGRLTAYGYFLDLHNEAGDVNSNQTFGLSLTGNVIDTPVSYHAEYAYQTDAFDSPLDYGTHYAHGALSVPLFEGLKGTLGLEYLGSNNGVGFKTPLATLHKFNGFADRFLATPAAGLTDLYGTVSCRLPWALGVAVWYHHFQDADFDTTLGNEVDLVLTKDLGRGISLLAKGALFRGSNGEPDVNRATLELSYRF